MVELTFRFSVKNVSYFKIQIVNCKILMTMGLPSSKIVSGVPPFFFFEVIIVMLDLSILLYIFPSKVVAYLKSFNDTSFWMEKDCHHFKRYPIYLETDININLT